MIEDIGKPFAGSYCGECGKDANHHFQQGHQWKQIECPRDANGKHGYSQSGDGGDIPCSVCNRRNPKFFPEDWMITNE